MDGHKLGLMAGSFPMRPSYPARIMIEPGMDAIHKTKQHQRIAEDECVCAAPGILADGYRDWGCRGSAAGFDDGMGQGRKGPFLPVPVLMDRWAPHRDTGGL